MCQNHSILRTRLLSAAFAFFICLFGAATVSAVTYTVTRIDDRNTTCTQGATPDCSLREAVTLANGSAANDVIVFQIPATSCNATTGVCTITLTTGELNIMNNGSLTINGTGANRLAISGNNQSRVFFVNPLGNLTLNGLTVTGGNGVGTVVNTNGGGIYDSGGTVAIINSIVSNNTTTGIGGGVYNTNTANTLVTITNSTISNNTATSVGGGVRNLGTTIITNSTISNNTTISAAGGGGLSNTTGTTTVRNSTISNNTANGTSGGGGIRTTGGTVNLQNTIVAANNGSSTAPDIAGIITSQGYNLIGNNTGGTITATTGDQIGTTGALIDPLLGPLANNGGTTPTLALLSGSPAIDRGNSTLAADQRRVIRFYDIFIVPNASGGNGADIGAFELIPTSALGWGLNSLGAVGDGTSGAGTNRNLPTAIAGGFTDIVAVEGGVSHALALRSNGTLLAWGENSGGRLGDGTTTQRTSPVVVSGGLTNVVATAGGSFHSLALLADGTIRAWGVNSNGQLGDNSTTGSSTPVTVTGISTAVAIAAGGQSSYALLADGSVRAWGRNAEGQLGDNTTTTRLTPVQVLGLTANVVSIDGGNNSAYALLADGSVRAWGANLEGRLGDGTTTQRNAPVTPLNLGSNVVQIAGGDRHGVALKADGTVLTWGDDANGQLGDGAAGGFNATPTAITLANVVEIKSTIGFVTYARRRDGSLVAWGFNGDGEVGNGTTASAQATPVAVSADTGIGFFGASSFNGYAGSPLAGVAAGANQFVRLGDATVNFSNVSTAGNLQIRTFDPAATGLSVPTGFTLLTNSNGFDITSSAQFTGFAAVCLKVPGVISATDFGKLFILHDDDGDGALDATGTFSRDYRRREICRTTTSFSPFVLAINPATTAAAATVGGRVTTANGTPIKGVRIIMTDAATGEQRTATSTAFGYYRFSEVAAGETYIFTAASKRFSFAQPTQVRSVTAEVDDVNFTAQE